MTLCFIIVTRAEVCAVIPNCPSVPKTKKQATYSTRLFYIYGVGEEEGEREDRVRRGDREGVERKRGDSVKSKKTSRNQFSPSVVSEGSNVVHRLGSESLCPLSHLPNPLDH